MLKLVGVNLYYTVEANVELFSGNFSFLAMLLYLEEICYNRIVLLLYFNVARVDVRIKGHHVSNRTSILL